MQEELMMIDLSQYKLVSPSSIKRKKCEETTFIDIEVEDNHVFFVHNKNNDMILSHNSDGKHIAVLLLTFFYRYMKPLIEAGHLYVGRAPLFKIKSGKEIKYAFNDNERDNILNEYKTKDKKTEVNRLKGLGEFASITLEETTFNPDTRILNQITITDAIAAEEMCALLMGNDIPARRKFIEDNALNVKNLDI